MIHKYRDIDTYALAVAENKNISQSQALGYIEAGLIRGYAKEGNAYVTSDEKIENIDIDKILEYKPYTVEELAKKIGYETEDVSRAINVGQIKFSYSYYNEAGEIVIFLKDDKVDDIKSKFPEIISRTFDIEMAREQELQLGEMPETLTDDSDNEEVAEKTHEDEEEFADNELEEEEKIEEKKKKRGSERRSRENNSLSSYESTNNDTSNSTITYGCTENYSSYENVSFDYSDTNEGYVATEQSYNSYNQENTYYQNSYEDNASNSSNQSYGSESSYNNEQYTVNELNQRYYESAAHYSAEAAQTFYNGVPVVSVSVQANSVAVQQMQLNNPSEIRMFCDNIQISNGNVIPKDDYQGYNYANNHADNYYNSVNSTSDSAYSSHKKYENESKNYQNSNQKSDNVIDYSQYYTGSQASTSSYQSGGHSNDTYSQNSYRQSVYKDENTHHPGKNSDLSSYYNRNDTVVTMHLANGQSVRLDEVTHQNVTYSYNSMHDNGYNNSFVGNEITQITESSGKTSRYFSVENMDDFSYSTSKRENEHNNDNCTPDNDKRPNGSNGTGRDRRGGLPEAIDYGHDNKGSDNKANGEFDLNDSLYVNSRMHERGSSIFAQILRNAAPNDLDPVAGARKIEKHTRYFRISVTGMLAKGEANHLVKFYEANNKCAVLADSLRRCGIDKDVRDKILRKNDGTLKSKLSHEDFANLRSEFNKKFSSMNSSLRSLDSHNIPELEDMLKQLRSKNKTGKITQEERQLLEYTNIRKMEEATKHHGSKKMGFAGRVGGLVMMYASRTEVVQGIRMISPYLTIARKVKRWGKKKLRTMTQNLEKKITPQRVKKREAKEREHEEKKIKRKQDKKQANRRKQNQKRIKKEEKYEAKHGVKKRDTKRGQRKRNRKAANIKRQRVRAVARGRRHEKIATKYRNARMKISRTSSKFKAAKNIVAGDTEDRAKSIGKLAIKLLKKISVKVGEALGGSFALMFLIVLLVILVVMAGAGGVITAIDGIIPDFDMFDDEDDSKTYVQKTVEHLIENDKEWYEKLKNIDISVYKANNDKLVTGGQDPVTGKDIAITEFEGKPKIYWYDTLAYYTIKDAKDNKKNISLNNLKEFPQVTFRTNAKDVVSAMGQYKLITDCSISDAKKFAEQLWQHSHIYTTGVSKSEPCHGQKCRTATVACYDKETINSRKDFKGKNYNFLPEIKDDKGCILYYCNDKESYEKAIYKKDNAKATFDNKEKGCVTVTYEGEFDSYCEWQSKWNPAKSSATIDIDSVPGVTAEMKKGYKKSGYYKDEPVDKKDKMGTIDECSFSSKVYNNRKIKTDDVKNECINHNLLLVMEDGKPATRVWNGKEYWVSSYYNMSNFNSDLNPCDGYFLVEEKPSNVSVDNYVINIATYQNNPIWFYACQGHTVKSRTFSLCVGHKGCSGHEINYCLGHCSLEIYASISGVTESEIEAEAIRNTILGVDNLYYSKKKGYYSKEWSGYDEGHLSSVLNKYTNDWESLYDIPEDTFKLKLK